MEEELREIQAEMGWTDETLLQLLLTHASDALVDKIRSIAAEESEEQYGSEEHDEEDEPDMHWDSEA